MNDKIRLGILSLLMMISGVLHLIAGFLSIGLLELSVTLIIFTCFFLPLSFLLIIQIRKNSFTEKENIVIMSTTVSFLNILMLFTQILINSPQNRYYIYLILIVLMAIDIINFSLVFEFKSRIEQMDFNDKLNYFCLVVIRGLGISLIFNTLTWIGYPPNPNLLMILYVVLFGSLYLLNGYFLFLKKKKIIIDIEVLILLFSALIIGLLLYSYFPHPNILISAFLYILVIPMIIYKIKIK
ncbi:MAG: hypothetical protein ACQERB_14690 [Promethearchaeati archaeon]